MVNPDHSNKIQTIQVKTWDEFRQIITHHSSVYGRIFRGHGNPEWKLSSQFERWLMHMKKNHVGKDVRILFSEGAFEKIRDNYINLFKHYIFSLNGPPKPLDENELWIIGRHHGLITPLLDWTSNPYIAAFFAFFCKYEEINPGIKYNVIIDYKKRSVYNGNVAIWQMTVSNQISKLSDFEVIRPKQHLLGRVKAQQGVFTYLKSYIHHNIEDYFQANIANHFLVKYEIPFQEFYHALVDFDLMNISYATLFPDYYGAAMQANLQLNLNSLKLIKG